MSRRWPGVGVALARSQQSPDAITAQPPDHQRLDSLPFAKTFRRKVPLFDAAIWSSHDLQIAAYDALLAGRSQGGSARERWYDRCRAICPR